MTDLAVLAEPGALDQYANAGEFVMLSCERAKEWLTKCIEHGEIEQIIELKSQAEAIRVFTTTQQLGRDAQLAATEIIRRAERGKGLVIRKMQENEEMGSRQTSHLNTRHNQHGEFQGLAPAEKLPSPSDYFNGGQDITDTYAVTDGVTDEQFDEAISEAKAEGNLSRSNVVRNVARKKILDDTKAERPVIVRQMAAEGHTTDQIADYLGIGREATRKFCQRHDITVHADAAVGRVRKLDSRRIVFETVMAVNGIGAMLDHVDYSTLDPQEASGWVDALKQSIKSLTTLKNRLQEIAQP